ncbi:Looped-hinge helix DNA binding domain, AbrB family [Mesorhizobium plurifarium]|uniref:Looped-hinge helix DNA binding domain, AbrB family n=1 Tax=Mesorhizobium plurifarium TaxID=69974 RepID=A0A0K2VNW9_MESPL|nr:Looped-hinge helix DNA binding domain, AbrB family [Mesorhizobium plurifarium]
MGADANLTSKGQMTIPKHVRDALSLKAGDRVALTVVDGRLIGTPRDLEFADLAGFLGDPFGGPATLEEVDAAVRDVVGLPLVGVASRTEGAA